MKNSSTILRRIFLWKTIEIIRRGLNHDNHIPIEDKSDNRIVLLMISFFEEVSLYSFNEESIKFTENICAGFGV